MDRNELKRLIGRLRLRSDNTALNSSGSMERLNEFTDSLENMTEDLADEDEVDTLLGEIPGLIDEFETEDPRIVALLKRVRTALRGSLADNET